MGLLLFNAISSVGGGIALITDVIPEQVQWVQHNDFPSLYFPGVIPWRSWEEAQPSPRLRW